MTTQEVILRKLTAADGMVITDLATQTMREKFVYLGCEESADNFTEIAADTPLPEIDTTESEE